MKRKIISIDESLCVGCGNCTTSCEQGAIKIINGKAKLVNENFCDGLGKCIGHCPADALKRIARHPKHYLFMIAYEIEPPYPNLKLRQLAISAYKLKEEKAIDQLRDLLNTEQKRRQLSRKSNDERVFSLAKMIEGNSFSQVSPRDVISICKKNGKRVDRNIAAKFGQSLTKSELLLGLNFLNELMGEDRGVGEQVFRSYVYFLGAEKRT